MPLRSPRLFTANDGLATLGPDGVRLWRLLERRFIEWERETGAEARVYSGLVATSDLAKFDYFQNFPHLALCVSALRSEAIDMAYGPQHDVQGLAAVPHGHLADGVHLLPSAACYPVYLELAGETLAEPVSIGVMGRCFRNEREYEGLVRLHSFSMKEFVCVGHREAVQAHIGSFKQRVLQFVEAVGLPVAVCPAVDSFYDMNASRAVMQRLLPVKEEVVYADRVAIASFNFHRNFFGERCGIRLEDGAYAHSGCVAFGVERWIHALVDHFGGDVPMIERLLADPQSV